jgi:hypothetical protein
MDGLKIPDAPRETPITSVESAGFVNNGAGTFSDVETNVRAFCDNNPGLSVADITEATEGAYGSTTKILLITRPKLHDSDSPSQVFSCSFDGWPRSLKTFINEHPQLTVTATSPSSEGAYRSTTKMIIVAEQKGASE